MPAFTHTEIQTFQGGFDASWELDVFGGVRRSVRAATADEQAQIDSRRDTDDSLLAEVAQTTSNFVACNDSWRSPPTIFVPSRTRST